MINECMKISNGKVVPAQAIQSYVGIEVQLHLFLTQALDGVSVVSYRPCCSTQDKKSPVFTKQEAGWSAKQVWTLWRR